MNKISLFILAAVFTLAAGSANAQKHGYISIDQLVGLMPEVARLDSTLQRFQADSLNPQYAYLLAEAQRKDSIVNGKDSLKTPAAIRGQIRQELEGLIYQLQNWQGYVQNELQAKQNELLQPIYIKAVNAVKTVAKDNGYTYVYSKEALVVAPDGDDLLPLVARRLNIKLPPATATAAPKK